MSYVCGSCYVQKPHNLYFSDCHPTNHVRSVFWADKSKLVSSLFILLVNSEIPLHLASSQPEFVGLHYKLQLFNLGFEAKNLGRFSK